METLALDSELWTLGSPEPQHAWAVSLAFWLTLLLAAALYAVVALAPRFLGYLNLRNEFHANQVRLVTLERQVGYLHKVVDALENDPAFAAELARVDFDASRPGDERIAVSPHLTLDALPAAASQSVPAVSLPWYGPLVRMAAENGKLRWVTLLVSAILIVLAFTFMHDSQADRVVHAGSTAGWAFRCMLARYRK